MGTVWRGVKTQAKQHVNIREAEVATGWQPPRGYRLDGFGAVMHFNLLWLSAVVEVLAQPLQLLLLLGYACCCTTTSPTFLPLDTTL